MSFEDSIVTVNISATSATPTVPNSTTPACYAYHTHNADLIRTYFDLAGMVSDGFTTTEPAYLMAERILAQNPRPPEFKVIRGTSAPSQTLTFNVTDTNVGDVVGLILTDASGTTHAVQHTVTTGQTAAQIATALAAISVSGATLAVDGSITTQVDIAITAAGAVWFPSGIFGGDFQDTTALPSTHPDADLTAVVLVDSAWYGLSISTESPAMIENVGAWVESNNKIFAYHTTDADALGAGGGVFDAMADSSYKRSYGQWTGTPMDYPALGLMANMLTFPPGGATWAYKGINGAATDTLTPTQTTNITSNNGNFYIPVAGVSITFDGRSAQGQYMDIQQGLDALTADIQVRLFGMLVQNPKVPFTQPGIAQMANQVRASLLSFIPTGFISNDKGFEPQVTFPLIGSVSTSDKQNRTLKTINFTCTAQGAIHKVTVNGTVNI